MSKIKVSIKHSKNIDKFLKLKSIYNEEIQIAWIGQAGFIFKFKNKIFIIDPYLSDYLSKKYKGKLFPHIRLMKIPIDPKQIKNIDYLLCSHAHSDHMDPETLTILSQMNPEVKIIIPAAELDEVVDRGVKVYQTIQINDGELLSLESQIKIIGVAAAHETFRLDENRQHYFLGYVFDFAGIRIYHSGDCVPYDGLTQKLKELEIDLALLPINGRDEYRLKNNIAGNFLIPEVIDICKTAKIGAVIVHHFGMFAYNTVSEEELKDLRRASSSHLQIFVPEINTIYKVKKI